MPVPVQAALPAAPVTVVAWDRFQARTAALGRELQAEVVFTRARARVRSSRWLRPLRYVFDTVLTVAALTRGRPRVVVVTTPAVFAPMVVGAWCALFGSSLVVDCHTGALHDPRWRWSRTLHRVLLRHAYAVLAHTELDQELLAGWGVPVLLLPDDVPSASEAGPPVARGRRRRVLVAGSFDESEPVRAALEAACQLPDCDVLLTGDPRRLPPALRRPRAAHVRLTGFLQYGRFLAEMQAADVVAVFSDDANAMSRAAFEAIGLGRPLVLSDHAGARSRFGDAAVYCSSDPASMVAAIRAGLADAEQLSERAAALRSRLRQQREVALRALRDRLADAGRRPQAVLVISGYPFPDHVVLRNVKALLASGAAVDVICPWISNFTSMAASRPPGLRVYRLPVFHRRSHPFWYLWEYASLLVLALPLASLLGFRRRYAAVDVYNVTDLAVFTALVPRLRGARVVLNMLEMNPDLAQTRLGLAAGHPLIRLLALAERAAVHWASAVITVSETWRRVLLTRGAPADRITVVPNTQSIPSRPPRRDVHEGPPILISHGVQIPRYGLDLAIRALPSLLDDHPNLKLELLGGGEAQVELRRLARELGVDAHVEFIDFIPSWQEAIERVARATVGLVTVLNDGYGNLILPTRLIDFAALRVPAVCARLAAIEEYFPDDALAYFEPGDPVALAAAVRRLLDDPELRRRLTERAAAALRPIAWEEVSGAYLAALGLRDSHALRPAA